MAQHSTHIYEKSYIKEHGLSASVTHEVVIHKSKAEVWQLISNWGDAYIYTPNLDHSHCTSDMSTGLGSKRHCDIGKGSVGEEVLLWEEGERFIQQVYQFRKIPMVKKIVVELEVIEIDSQICKLVYTMAYKMPLGKLMKGTIGKSIRDNAYATKHYAETGDASAAKDPKQLKKLYYRGREF